MKLEGRRESTNVEDRRGKRPLPLLVELVLAVLSFIY